MKSLENTSTHSDAPPWASQFRPMASTLIPSIGRRQVPRAEAIELLRQTPPQHGPSWTCPKTGILIPKRLDANLHWREDLRLSCERDAELQAAIRAACRESTLFWINAFVWTFRQKMAGPDGKEIQLSDFRAHVPFITWTVQDELVAELEDGIENGGDLLIKKSRDMGASWLCLAVIHKRFQFHDNETFLEASRKEELVDERGNMDTLFAKHRYILRWQPRWLLPLTPVVDRYMHLGNPDRGSVIIGESTNGDLGRGGRKTAILLDEFASVQNGEAVDAATQDTSACRIFNSTPKGPGTAFHKIQKENRAKVLLMPWWRHPEKGLGAQQVVDPVDGKVKWTGPWFERESARRDRKSLAQEVSMDDSQSGEMFFDEREVEEHRRRHQRPPSTVGNLTWPRDLGDESKQRLIRRGDPDRVIQLVHEKHNPWRLWFHPVAGRPEQHLTYAIAADISNGSGASNSVLSVACLELRRIVAKFWSAHVSPEDLAEVAAFAGVWFGGRFAPAFQIWENNGPGGIYGRKMVTKLGYPHYYCQRIDNSRHENRTPRWGWNSNNERKVGMLGRYREALAKDGLVNPCRESLDECLDYCFTDNGELIPGKLREEAGGGRALHGDHVIADGLCVLGLEELPKHREQNSPAPRGSFAYRREEHERQLRREQDDWSG